MKKKILALALSAAMALTLMAGCGKNPTSATSAPAKEGGNTTSTSTTTAEASYEYDITVWCPELAVELTQKQIDDFNASNTNGIKLNATIEACSEADAATQMITDVEAGPDLFFFAGDQLSRLIMAGALNKLDEVSAEFVKTNNNAGAVKAATTGDNLYAFPITSDNGFFMFYNKEYVDESHLTSMEDLLADCEASGHPFCFDLMNGWYNAAFFFATGCDTSWEMDENGTPVSLNDTFNSDKGLIAAKGLYKFVSSSAYVNASSVAEFESAIPAAIVISGPWDNVTAKSILGENFGAAELPCFTVDGQSYHLNSFCGNKLIGVKPQSDADKATCVAMLAEYLSGEVCQTERFNELEWGPSNIVAGESDAVKANVGLAALAAQSPYAKPEANISGSWWDIAKAITTDVKDSDGSDASLQAALQNYADKCAAVINMTSDEKNAWSVIGAFAGTEWDTDFPMTRTAEPGVENYYSNDPIQFKAGDKFKVRQGASWDNNFGANGVAGGDDLVVEEDGTYFVKLSLNADKTEGMITLEKTSYNAWSVIGVIDWDTDIEMEIQDDGTTYVATGVEAAAGTEFKVRMAHAWGADYGADCTPGGANLVIADAGTYTITFDSLTGAITFVAE